MGLFWFPVSGMRFLGFVASFKEPVPSSSTPLWTSGSRHSPALLATPVGSVGMSRRSRPTSATSVFSLFSEKTCLRFINAVDLPEEPASDVTDFKPLCSVFCSADSALTLGFVFLLLPSRLICYDLSDLAGDPDSVPPACRAPSTFSQDRSPRVLTCRVSVFIG